MWWLTRLTKWTWPWIATTNGSSVLCYTRDNLQSGFAYQRCRRYKQNEYEQHLLFHSVLGRPHTLKPITGRPSGICACTGFQGLELLSSTIIVVGLSTAVSLPPT